MHGQRFSALIHEHVAQYRLPAQWDREKWRVVEVIQANLASHLPDLLEEIRGIADGAAIPLRDVLALNYWIEVLQATVGYGCSLVAFANTPEGVIVGKNSDHDLAAVRYLTLQFVHGNKEERSLSFMRGSFVGTSSTRAGVNAAGLAVCGAALIPSETNWDGVPVMALIGHLLSHCATVDETVDVARSLPPINYGANIMVADPSGSLAIVERLPHQFAIRRPQEDVIFNTNHCLCAETVVGMKDGTELVANSRQRFVRITELVPQVPGTSTGLKRILRDHADPGAVCQHGRAGLYTCASYLLFPSARKMWVADGSPCAAAFEEYHL
jgi:predicted choloylglycine hydrolase